MTASKKVLGIMLIFTLWMSSFQMAQGQEEYIPNEKIIFKTYAAEDDKTIIVLIGNLIKRKTSILICDKRGWMVFRMTLKDEIGFAGRFDLSELSGKEYSISVVQKGVKYTRFFYLGEEGPIMGNLEKYCNGQRTILKSARDASLIARLEPSFKR